MERTLRDIKEIQETRKLAKVNQLPEEGWVIDYRQHDSSHSRYVLIKF